MLSRQFKSIYVTIPEYPNEINYNLNVEVK